LDCTDHVSQQRVARRMALAIVDLLEPVDVDVGEDEASVSVPSAVDLVLERDYSKLAPESAGELIELGVSQLGSRVLAIVRGGSAVGRRELAVGRREPAVGLAVGGGLASIRGPLVGLRLGPVAISRGVVAVGGGLVDVGGRFPVLVPGCASVAVRPRGPVRALPRLLFMGHHLRASPGNAAGASLHRQAVDNAITALEHTGYTAGDRTVRSRPWHQTAVPASPGGCTPPGGRRSASP